MYQIYVQYIHIYTCIFIYIHKQYSKMRLLGQFQTCLFFLRKGSGRKKTPKPKTNDFNHLRSLCALKECCLRCLVFA